MHTPPAGVSTRELKEMVQEVAEELCREPSKALRSSASVPTIPQQVSQSGCPSIVPAPTAQFVNVLPTRTPPQQFRTVTATPRSLTPRPLSPSAAQPGVRTRSPPAVPGRPLLQTGTVPGLPGRPHLAPSSPPATGSRTVVVPNMGATQQGQTAPQQPVASLVPPRRPLGAAMDGTMSSDQQMSQDASASGCASFHSCVRRPMGPTVDNSAASRLMTTHGSHVPEVRSARAGRAQSSGMNTSAVASDEMMGNLLQSMEALQVQLARNSNSGARSSNSGILPDDSQGTIPIRSDILATAATTVTALAQALQNAAAREQVSDVTQFSQSPAVTSPEDITLSPPPSPIAARRNSPQPRQIGGGSSMSSLMASPSSSSTVSASPLRSNVTMSPASSAYVNRVGQHARAATQAPTPTCQIVTEADRRERDQQRGLATPTFPDPSGESDPGREAPEAHEVTRQLSFRVPTHAALNLEWNAPHMDWASRFEAVDKERSDFQARYEQSQEELLHTKQQLAALQEQLAASQASSSSSVPGARTPQLLQP